MTSEPLTVLCVDARDGRLLWKRAISYVDTVAAAAADGARQALEASAAIEAKLRERERELATQKRAVRKRGADAKARAELDALSKEVSALRASLQAYEYLRTPDAIPRMGSASSTPITDGRSLYAVFGNGVVAALSLDGALEWARWLGAPVEQMNGYHRGQGASPLLVGDRLIVGLNHLVAFSTADGRELWRGPRWRDFGTPAAASLGGVDVLLTGSGAAVDLRDGRVLADDLALLFYIGPVVDGDRAFFVGGGSDHLMQRAGAAYQLKSSGGSVRFAPLWRRPLGAGTAYSTPLVHDGLLYAVSRDRELVVLDAAAGTDIYRQVLDLGHEDVYSSPSLAGGRIYVSAGGRTLVLKPGRQFAELARNELEDFRSTPLFVDDRVYIRGLTKLWCLREGGAAATR
jgi:outer membrane protein assembly factor BamB